MADDDAARDELGHGLRPARGVMFGLLFTAVGLAVITALCLLGLAVT